MADLARKDSVAGGASLPGLAAAAPCHLPSRWAVLEGLVAHAEDAGDHNLPLMYWYAAEPLADVDAGTGR